MNDRTRKKEKTSRKIGWKNTLVYEAMVMPSLILFLVFTVYPFLTTIRYSFTNYSNDHLFDYEFVGLQNYLDVFRLTDTTLALKNTFIYAILLTGLQILLAVPLAIAISNKKVKGKGALRTMFYYPGVVSSLIVGFIWKFLFSTSYFGPINNALKALGLPMINYFGDPDIALYSVIFTQVWQWLGYAVIIISANLMNIPDTYHESAKVDGANGWQRFRYITMPHLYSSISFLLIGTLTGGLKVYDVFVSTTEFGPMDSTLTVMGYMVNFAIGRGYMGLGSAFSVVFFIILIAITKLLTTLLSKWEEKIQ